MKRDRAIALAEDLLRRLVDHKSDWPVSLIKEVYVFGSVARGALAPGDLDIAIEHDTNDDRWSEHFVSCLTQGRSPYVQMRRLLVGTKRSCQLMFNSRRDAGPELTLLWRRGEPYAAAHGRLHAIPIDPAAGRAPRDAMLPQFDGLENWIPLYRRQHMCDAVANAAITIERIQLSGGEAEDDDAWAHIWDRWKPSSPLWRAANAVVAYWESHDIDPGRGHLHGKDVRDKTTPYFAGFHLRYLRSFPRVVLEYGCVEWLEVVHPTRTKPLECLRIIPGANREFLRYAEL